MYKHKYAREGAHAHTRTPHMHEPTCTHHSTHVETDKHTVRQLANIKHVVLECQNVQLRSHTMYMWSHAAHSLQPLQCPQLWAPDTTVDSPRDRKITQGSSMLSFPDHKLPPELMQRTVPHAVSRMRSHFKILQINLSSKHIHGCRSCMHSRRFAGCGKLHFMGVQRQAPHMSGFMPTLAQHTSVGNKCMPTDY